MITAFSKTKCLSFYLTYEECKSLSLGYSEDFLICFYLTYEECKSNIEKCTLAEKLVFI